MVDSVILTPTFSKVDTALIRPGVFDARLSHVETRRNGESGEQFLVWAFNVDFGPGVTRRIDGTTSVDFYKGARSHEWSQVIKGDRVAADMPFDTAELHGKRCRVHVKAVVRGSLEGFLKVTWVERMPRG